MPYINRIFQSLEKLAAYEDKLTGATNSVELIKSGRRIASFFHGALDWFKRFKPVGKSGKTPVKPGKTPNANPEAATANTAVKTETAAANTGKTPVTNPETAAANTATKAETAAANTGKTPAVKPETATANAATGAENAAANAAGPGFLARHPYMAMAGSAGAAGLATYWLTPSEHYTPPSPNDYAHLTERYQQLPYIT